MDQYPPIMFATRQLEEQFRRFLAPFKHQEVGGYFFTTYAPDLMPSGARWREFKALDLWLPSVISSWMVIPNHSDKPETSWRAWDMEKVEDVAKATAKSLGGGAVHFHTHPLGSTTKPSQNDIVYWTKWCSGQGVIITQQPLRLASYFVLARRAAVAAEVEVRSGGFFSWREKQTQHFFGGGQ